MNSSNEKEIEYELKRQITKEPKIHWDIFD